MEFFTESTAPRIEIDTRVKIQIL